MYYNITYPYTPDTGSSGNYTDVYLTDIDLLVTKPCIIFASA